MDIEVGHVPVAPSPPRRRGVVVGLVAAVGVVVIGLIVWFFVVPRTGDNAPTFGPGGGAPSIGAGTPGPRPLVDIVQEPAWTHVADTSVSGLTVIVDPQAGDIAIVVGDEQSKDAPAVCHIEAVDLATGAVLWDVHQEDAAWRCSGAQFHGSSGYLVIATDPIDSTPATIESIDARTGMARGTVSLPAGETLLGLGGGMAFTHSESDDETCVRDLADPSACRWRTGGRVVSLTSATSFSDPTFGGGRWVNTDAGVLDVRTGKPAGFGADGTYYDGPDSDHIVRVDRDARTVQPWDTTHDRPLNLAVHIGGVPPDGGGYIIDPAASRLVVPAADFGAAGSIVTSYDWGAGEQRWQTTVHSTSLTVGGVACAGTVLVRDGSTSSYVVAPTTALSASDGRPLWNDQVLLVGSGQRVVYLGGSGGSPVLDAYDAASADFAHLWSLDWPAALFNIVTAAGHVVAISMPPPMDSPAPGDTNHLWVLSGA